MKEARFLNLTSISTERNTDIDTNQLAESCARMKERKVVQ